MKKAQNNFAAFKLNLFINLNNKTVIYADMYI